MPSRNTCLDEAVKKAYALQNPPVHLECGEARHDEQLSPEECLIADMELELNVWTADSQERARALLGRMDTSEMYLVRTGYTGGAGHFRLMYHNASDDSWCMYSSETSNYSFRVTDAGIEHVHSSGALGEDFDINADLGFTPSMPWGFNAYSLSIYTLSPARLEAIKNYVARERNPDAPETFWCEIPVAPCVATPRQQFFSEPRALPCAEDFEEDDDYLWLDIMFAVLSFGVIPLLTYVLTGDWRMFRSEEPVMVEVDSYTSAPDCIRV